MAKKASKKELGKGIRALLSNIESEVNDNPKEEVVKELSNNFALIPIEQIEVNPNQPRKDFDETALKELSDSIKLHGLIQPITVRRLTAGQFQLISGERRLRASKMADLQEIPTFIRLANDAEMMEMALVENTHREDLNPVEIAITYQRLIDEFDLTHQSLSERVETSRTSVTNFLRLLKAPPAILSALKEREISMGHARALLGIDDFAFQNSLLQNIMEQGLSVRAVEALVQKWKEPAKAKTSKTPELPVEYKDVQDSLSRHFGSKVAIKRNSKTGKGSITINFADDSDLNRILELIEE